MDVLDYAEQTAEVNVRLMATTDKIFRHYGSKIGGYSREAMMLFRHDKVMEYIQLLQESKQEGERIKQKMMMREALRQANKGRL